MLSSLRLSVRQRVVAGALGLLLGTAMLLPVRAFDVPPPWEMDKWCEADMANGFCPWSPGFCGNGVTAYCEYGIPFPECEFFSGSFCRKYGTRSCGREWSCLDGSLVNPPNGCTAPKCEDFIL
jgi:hypothetical protein